MRTWRGKKPAAAVLVALLFVWLAPYYALAGTPSGGANQGAGGGANGLRVSPVRPPDIPIKPGESHTINILVSNITNSTTDLQVVVNDFVASPNETGQPTLILDPNQFAPRNSLKRYIQKVPNFTLRAGEQKSIPVTITMPKDATGGGYYGAVRFAPASASNDPNTTVSLAGSVGTLLLVKVPGDIKEQLSVASFDVRHKGSAGSFFTTNKSLSSLVRFQNGGNIQVAPFGKVLLKNRSGKILGSYEVNDTDPRGNVLPDSIRRFEVDLKNVGSYGQYKLEGNFGYGSGGQLLSASTTFYVVPVWMVFGLIALLLLLAFLIFGLPKLIKAYNRRILAQASKGRRK